MNDEAPNPLWLPRGSVRAVIALIVVGTVMFMVADGREVPAWAQAFAGSVVIGYFGARAITPRVISSLRPPADLEAADTLRRAREDRAAGG